MQLSHRKCGPAARSLRTARHPRSSMPVWCAAKPEIVERQAPVEVRNTLEPETPSTSGRNIAIFKASKQARQPIAEAQRPLEEYMCLPASQYSVLDGRKVERVDDTTFRCHVGQLRFLSWEVEPVITVRVQVEPEERGCTISLLGCKLQGSSFVNDINDRFTATMTNVVRCRDAQPGEGDEEEAGEGQEAGAQGGRGAVMKEISSDTTIQVTAEVPAWCSFLPVSSISGVGSGVVQGVLNAMVPRFLQQLQRDYGLWASGDDSRRPVGEL